MRPDSEIPNFLWGTNSRKARVVLEWRGHPGAFWNIHVAGGGPFRPALEVDIEEARAVRAALNELEARQEGAWFPCCDQVTAVEAPVVVTLTELEPNGRAA
jgi:hypothetical protein